MDITGISKPYSRFNFTGRKKPNSRNNNASDEINALLNYGYAILESEVKKAINIVGLDYSIDFLHEINQSHTPLVMICKSSSDS